MINKCQRCECSLDDEACVYRVNGLNGHFCKECAVKLSHTLGVGFKSAMNLLCSTNEEVNDAPLFFAPSQTKKQRWQKNRANTM